MIEKPEIGPSGPEKPKIENLAQLKSLFEKEFGQYSFFLNPTLKSLSSFKPSGMFPDVERERKLEKLALENTKVTPDIIDKLNKTIGDRAEIMKQEIKYAKKEKKEEHLKECQEILDLFENKKLSITEEGTVEFKEEDVEEKAKEKIEE